MFVRCPVCGKPKLPSGLSVIYLHVEAPAMFCNGGDECMVVECQYCGYLVHPHYHSWQACNQLQGKRHRPPLRHDEVLAEAEAILKRGRRDDRWEGAE